MAELREYNVKIGQHETTMQLNDEDAKRFGGDATLVEPEGKSHKPQNKARTAQNKKADDNGGSSDVH